MELDNIIHMISDIAAEVFERPGIQLKLSDSPSNIKEWDSLTQIVLIAEIERRLNIKFSFKDLASIRTMKDLINIIATKINETPENET